MTAQPLITIRPGPVLHVWQGGYQLAAVALTAPAALTLAADLLREIKLGRRSA